MCSLGVIYVFRTGAFGTACVPDVVTMVEDSMPAMQAGMNRGRNYKAQQDGFFHGPPNENGPLFRRAVRGRRIERQCSG